MQFFGGFVLKNVQQRRIIGENLYICAQKNTFCYGK